MEDKKNNQIFCELPKIDHAIINQFFLALESVTMLVLKMRQNSGNIAEVPSNSQMFFMFFQSPGCSSRILSIVPKTTVY
jgi:hypothetical protein